MFGCLPDVPDRCVSRYSGAPGLMQERVPLSLRHVGLLALASAAIGLACHDEGPLSDQEMTLLRAFTLPPEGPPVDASNIYGDLPAAQVLGKLLYFDGGYSGPLGAYNVKNTNGALGAATDEGKVSCQSCHDPMTAGVDHRSTPSATSLGASYTSRNAPTVINAAYAPLWQFWDGRADSLWSQALLPPEGDAECAGSRLRVVHLLDEKYRTEYEAAFGAGSLPVELADLSRFPKPGNPGDGDLKTDDDKRVVNGVYANFGKAIAAYERRLVSNNFQPSPFDAFMAGDTQAMSAAALRGARLFVGRAGCVECHRGPTFTDFSFHNVGAPQTGEYVPATDLGRYNGIDLIEARMADTQYDFTRRSLFSDQVDDTHLMALTQSGADDATKSRTQGQFKTPSLRNVNKTAPYMHDGAYPTLWDVVNHYNFGGATGPFSGAKDPALSPLLLTDAELGDLVEFLRALDDGPANGADDLPGGLLGPPS
jgi:cytochrome c peroxidase